MSFHGGKGKAEVKIDAKEEWQGGRGQERVRDVCLKSHKEASQ